MPKDTHAAANSQVGVLGFAMTPFSLSRKAAASHTATNTAMDMRSQAGEIGSKIHEAHAGY